LEVLAHSRHVVARRHILLHKVLVLAGPKFELSRGFLGGFSVHFVEARGNVAVFLDAFQARAASFDLGPWVELSLG